MYVIGHGCSNETDDSILPQADNKQAPPGVCRSRWKKATAFAPTQAVLWFTCHEQLKKDEKTRINPHY